MNSRVPVAKGGMFGAADRPSYSRGTRDLLKVMMEESKLTNFQRRTLRDSLKGGQSLPVKVAPTSSDRKAKVMKIIYGGSNATIIHEAQLFKLKAFR